MADPKKSVAIVMGLDKIGSNYDETHDHGESTADDYKIAAAELFDALGIEPKDPEAARDALKSFVDICMSKESE